ncbi:MAG: mevalonate kinase [Myxococcales bacterium]|nr:mevalonate kinase [Myxococcales bacterium]
MVTPDSQGSNTQHACGKVILLGEHSVVYGQPALAAGLARGAEATLTPVDRELVLDVDGLVSAITVNTDNDLGRALASVSNALESMGGRTPRGHLQAKLHLPAGGGVGSSAALGVACARALALQSLGRALTLDESIELGTAWERVFHGNPSGLDHTAAAYGGVGIFVRGRGWTRVAMKRPLRVLFADTGERTPTKETVGNVAKLRERKPEMVDNSCEAIGVLVRNAALAVQDADWRALGQLMDLNQNLLSGLMVSTERTELLCRVARARGAFGAKLTGGGGGGCVIAIAPDDAQSAVLDAWRGEGARVFDAMIE